MGYGRKYSIMDQQKIGEERLLEQTIFLQNFWRLSSTNFTWSILEYFVSYVEQRFFKGILYWSETAVVSEIIIGDFLNNKWMYKRSDKISIWLKNAFFCVVLKISFRIRVQINGPQIAIRNPTEWFCGNFFSGFHEICESIFNTQSQF